VAATLYPRRRIEAYGRTLESQDALNGYDRGSDPTHSASPPRPPNRPYGFENRDGAPLRRCGRNVVEKRLKGEQVP
jgi:hypothetical protein